MNYLLQWFNFKDFTQSLSNLLFSPPPEPPKTTFSPEWDYLNIPSIILTIFTSLLLANILHKLYFPQIDPQQEEHTQYYFLNLNDLAKELDQLDQGFQDVPDKQP